jgi:transposase-like protein
MQYSEERKEALLRQMMPPQNRPVSELARESGITDADALYLAPSAS